MPKLLDSEANLWIYNIALSVVDFA